MRDLIRTKHTVGDLWSSASFGGLCLKGQAAPARGAVLRRIRVVDDRFRVPGTDPYVDLLLRVSLFLPSALESFFSGAPAAAAEAHFEGAYKANYFIADDELGYGLTPWKRRVSSIKRSDKDGGLIYNVTYQINALGFRDAIHNGGASPVFFFGDSFTFGEGVDDDDTLPAQFSRIAGRTVFNFGVHGYGPHQFLRMLEVDRPEKLGVADKPALVVYTLLADHVDRAAGRASWDREGPLYELSPAGLVYRGSFRSHRPHRRADAGQILRVSADWSDVV